MEIRSTPDIVNKISADVPKICHNLTSKIFFPIYISICKLKKKSGLGKRPKKLKNMLPLQNEFLFVSLIHAYLAVALHCLHLPLIAVDSYFSRALHRSNSQHP